MIIFVCVCNNSTVWPMTGSFWRAKEGIRLPVPIGFQRMGREITEQSCHQRKYFTVCCLRFVFEDFKMLSVFMLPLAPDEGNRAGVSPLPLCEGLCSHTTSAVSVHQSGHCINLASFLSLLLQVHSCKSNTPEGDGLDSMF